MSGVYEVAIEILRSRNDNSDRGITVALFTKVMNLYIRKVFEYIIAGGVYRLLNKFGYWFVAQSLCIRYNPTKIFYITDKDGNKKSFKKNIELVNGRWAYMFWDVGKKWRTHKFVPAPEFKIKIADRFLNGENYLEMDLKKYGRHASPTYIQIRK